MTAVLHRFRDLFLAPAQVRPLESVVERAVPSTVAVLSGRDDAVAAIAVAITLASRSRQRCAVVCRWTGTDGEIVAQRLALGAATKLARRLRHRGLDVLATGRAAVVTLPSDPSAAATAAQRVTAAAGDVPIVLSVAGPRPHELGPCLSDQDRILVVPSADAPASLADLAVTDAARAGKGASVLTLAWTPITRSLVATGLLVPHSIRVPTLAALLGREG